MAFQVDDAAGDDHVGESDASADILHDGVVFSGGAVRCAEPLECLFYRLGHTFSFMSLVSFRLHVGFFLQLLIFFFIIVRRPADG